MFDKNQRDAQQRSTTRPSCKICRQEIDGVKLTAQERRKMETKRPPDKTIFVCPICEKRTIVGITANIVRDHDHRTGKGREWICDSCNTGLGRFKDDIVLLEKVISYLKRFETNTWPVAFWKYQARMTIDVSCSNYTKALLAWARAFIFPDFLTNAHQ